MVLLQGFMWYKQGAVATRRTWGPLIFISSLSSSIINNQYRQSLLKISGQVLFQWNDLKQHTAILHFWFW